MDHYKTHTPATADDTLLTLTQAAKLLPTTPHPSALWRWATNGCDAGGERVHLRVMRFGRRLFTTPEALREFGEALGEAHVAARRADDERSSTEQQDD